MRNSVHDEEGRAAPIDWARHTMGPALLPYLKMKVHSMVQQREWRRIAVVGQHDRSCIISDLEKKDKLFNWQRPTAEIRGNELVMKCYPGRDYVNHYALMTATYLALTNRFRNQVFFELPSVEACDAAVARVGLEVREGEVVIVGWGVTYLAGSIGWTFGDGYAWKRLTSGKAPVTFLGFLHSIWGDVAGRIVTRLARLGARRILYVGKVGTLDPTLIPNSVLATGSESLVGGQRIAWEDFFNGEAALDPAVVVGRHVTSASTLLESQDWLDQHKSYSFVDPEIGEMGAAAFHEGVPYGYLHIVSNNLARRYEADLSNERLPLVLTQREGLLERAKLIIERRLRRIAG